MLDRRLFMGALAAGGVSAASDVPTKTAKVTKLFKSPEGHPNGLESTPEGVWVGEQISDTAYLLDWTTGKVLKKVATEPSNTSGIAWGGGFRQWKGHRPTCEAHRCQPGW